MIEFFEGIGVVLLIVAAAPAIRFGAFSWLRIRSAEAELQFERKAMQAASDDAAAKYTTTRLPERMKRADELDELTHREAIAKQTARTILAEANIELAKQRAAKAIERNDESPIALPNETVNYSYQQARALENSDLGQRIMGQMMNARRAFPAFPDDQDVR